tara:strand:- start:661 stop:948 length:288 start_codon:yes stop_codon:yes gene_type:complete
MAKVRGKKPSLVGAFYVSSNTVVAIPPVLTKEIASAIRFIQMKQKKGWENTGIFIVRNTPAGNEPVYDTIMEGDNAVSYCEKVAGVELDAEKEIS